MATVEKRITKSGKVAYRVKIRLKGCPDQTATFKRKTDASKWIQNTESAIREGRYFKTAKAKKHTLTELIDRYIRDVLPKKTSKMKQDQTTQLVWWKKKAGAHLLADITPSLIVQFRDELFNTRKSSTVCRYMAALSHAFTIAVNEWDWLDDSPMHKVKKPVEPRGRDRYLNNNERETLLQTCKQSGSSYLYTIVIMALCTGMRRGEIMTLIWSDIHFKQKCLILRKTKNGERRRVALSDHLIQILKQYEKIRRIDTDMLFPNNPRITGNYSPIEFNSSWRSALKKSGIKDFRFHDLRHSAASYLAMNGATSSEIAEILGHKTLNMVKRYAHLSESHTSRVVESMNDSIFNNGF